VGFSAQQKMAMSADAGSHNYGCARVNVVLGEKLTGIIIESQWLLCVNSSGQKGWVPIHNVKKARALVEKTITVVDKYERFQ
jgi:hypothetical protein